MTDELDRLGTALRAAPEPDAQARAAALRRAMASFDEVQASADGARQGSDGPRRSGVWIGVRTVLTALTSRRFLAATTSVAALCLGLVVILPLQGPVPVSPRMPESGGAIQPEGLTTADATAADGAPPMDAQLIEPQVIPEVALSDSVADSAAPAPAEGALARRSVGSQEDDQEKLAFDAVPVVEAQVDPMLDAEPDDFMTMPEQSEAFAGAAPNPVQVTAESPVSTFSIDVDTASYSILRSFLMAGVLPPPEAVRIEEMVNYFPYSYSAPEPGGAPFRPDIAVMQTPWNPDTSLVRIGVQGFLPPLADRPPLNLVFLIDTSGSMQDANKLPLLKQGFRLMLGQLRPEDQVAIVAYAGSAGQVLAPTPARDRAAILAALDRLEAGGSTAGEEGLQLAYTVAGQMADPGEVSRVVLATDGDFNVGLADPASLEGFIAEKRRTGTYLSVLGFGRGNLDDATMQALAQAGNGTAAYIDTAQEARKVLVDQLTGALFPIADDVKIQVEWNPAAVAEWRLIGYETRALRREDFGNDRVDAGEVGAGRSVTALYEVTAPGSPALRNEPLRYGAAPVAGDASELGMLRLRWKAPGSTGSTLAERPILPSDRAADDDTRFAAAIAGFGQLLTQSSYLGGWGWDQAIALAEGARGEDAFGYRAEAVTLMRLAQSLGQ